MRVRREPSGEVMGFKADKMIRRFRDVGLIVALFLPPQSTH